MMNGNLRWFFYGAAPVVVGGLMLIGMSIAATCTFGIVPDSLNVCSPSPLPTDPPGPTKHVIPEVVTITPTDLTPPTAITTPPTGITPPTAVTTPPTGITPPTAITTPPTNITPPTAVTTPPTGITPPTAITTPPVPIIPTVPVVEEKAEI